MIKRGEKPSYVTTFVRARATYGLPVFSFSDYIFKHK